MSDKTEPPTPKKLREAREKGQVAKSKDLVQALLFIVIFAVLLGSNDSNMRTLGALMVLPGDFYVMPFTVAVREVGTSAINAGIAVVMPLIGASAYFPFTVGGMGIREMAFVKFYELVGIAEHDALAASLAFAAVVYSAAAVGGIVHALNPLTVQRSSGLG